MEPTKYKLVGKQGYRNLARLECSSVFVECVCPFTWRDYDIRTCGEWCPLFEIEQSEFSVETRDQDEKLSGVFTFPIIVTLHCSGATRKIVVTEIIEEEAGQ